MFETNVSTPSKSTEQPRNMQALCCSQITRSLRKSSKHLSYALLNYHTDTISIIKVENSNIQFEQIHNVWVPFRWYPWYLIHIEFMFSIFTERQSYLNCSSTNESNFILQKVLVSLLLQLPVIWNWFKSKPVVNNLYKKLVRKKKKKIALVLQLSVVVTVEIKWAWMLSQLLDKEPKTHLSPEILTANSIPKLADRFRHRYIIVVKLAAFFIGEPCFALVLVHRIWRNNKHYFVKNEKKTIIFKFNSHVYLFEEYSSQSYGT